MLCIWWLLPTILCRLYRARNSPSISATLVKSLITNTVPIFLSALSLNGELLMVTI